MTIACYFGCGTQIDPNDRNAWRRVTGWEHRGLKSGARRGGSDISMREPTGEFACPKCVSRLKAGINPQQGSLM
jgi:hypothetical protein